MASSSVSQDDVVDNDFEKNSRRSRIRTARARQINPINASSGGGQTAASCRMEAEQQQNSQQTGDPNLDEDINGTEMVTQTQATAAAAAIINTGGEGTHHV